MVSLGCPKALVDSERILTRLRAEGYAISPDYAGADAVIVNTCGFLDSAKAESLEAIGEALGANGRVIVTGCLGADEGLIRGAHPAVLAVTGPHQYEAVVDAVHAAVPPAPDPFIDLVPAGAVHLTPRHYSYLKISEGCNHKCRFCIIPDMRGRLVSRPAHAVLREAERLVAAGVRELLVISQDTSAYGIDRRHDAHDWRGREVAATSPTSPASSARSGPGSAPLRLSLPARARADPADGRGAGAALPRHPVPAQPPRRAAPHGPPGGRRADARRDRPLAGGLPGIMLRSTFIVGYPGETEAEFAHLLDWLDAAQLDRVGCFKYENVAGARANALPDHVPEPVEAGALGALHGQGPGDQRARSSPRGSAPRSRSSSTRSTPRRRPAEPAATPRRSTATSSSTRDLHS